MTSPMTDSPPPPNDAPAHEPPGDPGRSPLRDWWASLRRSSSDRLVGGVCGGLAKSTGVPRVLVIAAFVLASIPLIGIAAYALLWVLLPDENGRRVADDSRWREVLVAAVGSGFVLVVLGVSLDSLVRTLFDLMPWTLMLLGAVLIVRRIDGSDRSPSERASSERASSEQPPPPPFHQPAAETSPWPTPNPLATTPTPLAPPASPSSPAPLSSPASLTSPFPPTPPSPPVPPTPPAPRYRQPFRLPVVGTLTWALALIVVAVLGLLALNDRGVLGPGTILAAITVVFGAGLLVSAFFGKARGLILPALACVLAVLGLGVLNVRADNTLDAVQFTFTDGARLPEKITAGYGKSTIHLGALRLDQDRDLTITQTAGVVWVMLPVGATTELSIDVDAGTADAYRPFPGTDDYRNWATSGELPRRDDLLTAERAEQITDWSAQARGDYVLDEQPKAAGVSASYRLATAGEHTLRLHIELGVGEVRVLIPRWASVPSEVRAPRQACHDASLQTGPISCDSIADVTARMPLCANTAGEDVTYEGVFSETVRCEDLPAGEPDWPREPTCLDWDGSTI
ncbi:MAG: PspC domain-containing protein, partial [Actinobacteria bacterium]|nr:PspC domain-containing protein [Actinomycetota bacterium]